MLHVNNIRAIGEKKNNNKGHPGSYSLLLVNFIMFYRSIGSGLGIGRYSKSNDSRGQKNVVGTSLVQTDLRTNKKHKSYSILSLYVHEGKTNSGNYSV